MQISDAMIRSNNVPCTACSYCVDRCPKNLAIPELIKGYNENAMPEDPGPQACIGCRSCESVCPQGIKISQVMAQYAAKQKGASL